MTKLSANETKLVTGGTLEKTHNGWLLRDDANKCYIYATSAPSYFEFSTKEAAIAKAKELGISIEEIEYKTYLRNPVIGEKISINKLNNQK